MEKNLKKYISIIAPCCYTPETNTIFVNQLYFNLTKKRRRKKIIKKQKFILILCISNYVD